MRECRSRSDRVDLKAQLLGEPIGCFASRRKEDSFFSFVSFELDVKGKSGEPFSSSTIV